MLESTSPPIEARARAKLARMRLLQQVNFHVLWLSLLAIFGGLAAGLFWQRLGMILMTTGFFLMGLLLVESYAVYPRLICPRCRGRFFLSSNWSHWFTRISATQRHCLHCGLSLDQTS
jgi:hypothetical protein